MSLIPSAPFKADLAPDKERFIAHCKWLLSQNCGLAVFGTNSEANSLSMEERAMLLDELIAAGVDPSRMMPGTGCCSMMETVKLTKQAVGNGCAGVLMLPPFYYKDVSEEGIYRYFSEVVQRVGDARLKIYLYHIPPVAIVGITPKLVERLLAAYPSAIAGMKDSSGDWNNTKTFLDAFSKSEPDGQFLGLIFLSAANPFSSQVCGTAASVPFLRLPTLTRPPFTSCTRSGSEAGLAIMPWRETISMISSKV
jgi:dihydrodipicolinate synthase/N-acetylneuraminate lyase